MGGPHAKPLPPPREVIEHDNAVTSFPHTTGFKSAVPTAPVEPAASVEQVVDYSSTFYSYSLSFVFSFPFLEITGVVLGVPYLLN